MPSVRRHQRATSPSLRTFARAPFGITTSRAATSGTLGGGRLLFGLTDALLPLRPLRQPLAPLDSCCEVEACRRRVACRRGTRRHGDLALERTRVAGSAL